MTGLNKVVIVGAGPSGLLLALLLTKLSPAPQITVLEAHQQLDRSPRATHYSPSAVSVFRRAGIRNEVQRRGYVPKAVCWRPLRGPKYTGMPLSTKDQNDADASVLVLSVGDLCSLLAEELDKAGINVTFGEKVVGMGGTEDDAEQAWVEAKNVDTGKTSKYEADFVVGCDGGNSATRRLMHGKENFPGFTWDEQLVSTNTYYDFPHAPPDYEDGNNIIDNEHWHMTAKISADGLWRITYGDIPGLTDEELIARQPMKFEKMLPGNPKPGDYNVVSISPYKIHQRCVEAMAQGRVALVADAAHLCNPFGGLGLTGGIVDVEGLFDCLRGIHAGKADKSILKVYSDVRIKKYQELVNPISSDNLKRMTKLDPTKAMETDPFLQMVKKAEEDSEVAKQMHAFSYLLQHDFEAEWNN